METLTDPDSLLLPCEVGREVFPPVGPRGGCNNRRALVVRLQGALRPVELCGDHVEVLRQWLAAE